MIGSIMEFNRLQDKTLKRIIISDDNEEIHFIADDGRQWKMYHEQDCCEWVRIEEIIGDIPDIIDSPILLAEERVSNDTIPGQKDNGESFTWTFYELRTIKGSLTIRWYGESSGYYSESVNFIEIDRYAPVDTEAWQVAGEFVLDYDLDLDERYRSYFRFGGT